MIGTTTCNRFRSDLQPLQWDNLSNKRHSLLKGPPQFDILILIIFPIKISNNMAKVCKVCFVICFGRDLHRNLKIGDLTSSALTGDTCVHPVKVFLLIPYRVLIVFWLWCSFNRECCHLELNQQFFLFLCFLIFSFKFLQQQYCLSHWDAISNKGYWPSYCVNVKFHFFIH